MAANRGVLGGIKKWFMTQVWRFQQVAMLLTLMMMSLTVSLNVYSYMKWREGSGLLANTYVGVSLVLLSAIVAMWIFAYIWDRKAQMWREQMVVSAERNPFMNERLCAKDIVYMTEIFIPTIEMAAKVNPERRDTLDALTRWIEMNLRSDRALLADTKKVYAAIGVDVPQIVRRAEQELP
jgi:hypothetical protein